MFRKTEVDKLFEKMKMTDYLFYGSLIAISILVFAIPFGLEPVLMADSPAYLAGTLGQGIVPVYPFFIYLNKLIFSSVFYLQAVVIEQILFAAGATVFFVLFIKKAMGAGRIEAYLFLLLSVIPYTVLMPEGMTSRFIVTEALAYPCFYLLMTSVLNGIWENKISSVFIAEILAIFMALTRTQLQLVLVIPAGTFFLLWMRGKVWNEKMRMIYRFITGILLFCIIFLLSYSIYKQSNLVLQRGLVWITRVANVSEEEQKEADFSKEVAEKEDTVADNQMAGSIHEENNQNIFSQISGVIFTKVMIMAEREDAKLFQDDTMRQLYTYVYDRLEQDQLVLSAMDKNLMIADQLQIGLADIAKSVNKYLNDFADQYPDFEIDINGARDEFSEVLLKGHPFRWILSGILQFPFGLISSVFIHRRGMYWMSYLVTAVIYALAAGVCIVGKKDVKRREFMVVCISVNLLFVVATSMVFMPLKRYVNYGFGVFYIAFYCMIKSCIVDFARKGECG